MSNEKSLKMQLKQEFNLAETDFGQYQTDLHVRWKPGIMEYLKASGIRAETFRVQSGHPDAGQTWIDVPFMANA